MVLVSVLIFKILLLVVVLGRLNTLAAHVKVLISLGQGQHKHHHSSYK